tara:strand:+ start:398 stop:547 length:150 start_codon:yes stop_codon:yes gene_type:complete
MTFSLMIMGIAAIRSLIPLADVNNWSLSSFLVAATTCVAYIHILDFFIK